jgi:hypothetical protein
VHDRIETPLYAETPYKGLSDGLRVVAPVSFGVRFDVGVEIERSRRVGRIRAGEANRRVVSSTTKKGYVPL